MRRFLFRFVLFVILLAVGGYVAAQLFLKSSYAAGLVAQKLQDKFGVPVRVGSVDVGTTNCAACELEISEADSANLPPFLTVARAETDLTLSDIIHGKTEPNVLMLDNAKLVVRHDREGRLLTKFPKPSGPAGPIPEIRLHNSTVTVKRDGEPDCTFAGIDVVAKTDANRFTVVGTVTDPNWGGAWQVAAASPLDASSGTVVLNSAGVHITPEVLRRVPYVPAKIWKHFAADGDSPVKLQLAIGQAGEKIRYRIDLSPTNTKLYVPSIDLNAEQTRGQVIVEDNLVTLTEIRGKAANGELYMKSAHLDFRKPDTFMHFVLEANRLNLHGLPTSWRLPPRLGGLLSGQADLIVRIISGRTIPTGTGEGRVDGATLGVIPIPNYSLKIQADGEGLRFEPRLGK